MFLRVLNTVSKLLKLVDLQGVESSRGDAGKGRASTAAGAVQDIDFAFVGESQDLTAADLKALKLMRARGVVMAGDTAQAIYELGSPYKRVGIDIAGRTRVVTHGFHEGPSLPTGAEYDEIGTEAGVPCDTPIV